MTFDPVRVERIFSDGGNVAVRYDSLFVQVRTGRLELAAVEQLVRSLRLLRMRVNGPVGALSVLEVGAEVPAADVQRRQREVIEPLMSDPRLKLVVAVAGSDVTSTLVRATTRISARNVRSDFMPTVDAGVALIAEFLGVPHKLVGKVVAHARALARTPLRPG